MSDIDLLDLFGGGGNPKKSGQATGESSGAPIELMSQFLVHVTNGEMKEALNFCNQILAIEPENKLMLEYCRTLKTYIDRGLDDEEEDEEEEEEEDWEDDDDEDEDEDEDENGDSSDDEKQDTSEQDVDKASTAMKARKAAPDSGSHSRVGGEVKQPVAKAATSTASSTSNKSKLGQSTRK